MTQLQKFISFFDQVYVITCEIRRERVEKYAQTLGIEKKINIFSALGSCEASHLAVVLDALLKKYENILIFEDDFLLIDDSFLITAFNEIKDEYGIFSLGCKFPFGLKIERKLNNSFFTHSILHGSHAYCVNRKIFKRFLTKKEIMHNFNADGFLSELGCFVINNNAFTQENGFSPRKREVRLLEDAFRTKRF